MRLEQKYWEICLPTLIDSTLSSNSRIIFTHQLYRYIYIYLGYRTRSQNCAAQRSFCLQLVQNSFIAYRVPRHGEDTAIIARITRTFPGLKLRVLWIKNNPFREGTHTAGFPRRRVFHPATGQPRSNPLISLFLPLCLPRYLTFSSHSVAVSVATLSQDL